MLGGEKTSQQDRASYSLKTNPTFENGLRDNLTCFCFCFFSAFFFFFLSLPPFSTPWSLLVGFFSGCTVSWSQFIWPLSCSPRHEYIPSVCTAPPKWWKSILTRDQDLYDKQSLQLKAHQAHLNGRQKQKISAPCAFSWNPIENLLMPSPICATVLLLMLSFFLEGLGGGCRQGDELAWRRVWDRNGVGPLDKSSPPPSLFTATSGITSNTKSKTWWVAWSYMLAGRRFFFFLQPVSGTQLKAEVL